MKSPTYFTIDDVKKVLRAKQGSRTLEEFAAEVGVSFQLISNILLDRRAPGTKILKYLGFRKVTLYRRA